MKLIRVKSVAKKEIIQILRDPRSLIMALIIPLLMIILYGYCLSLDVDNLTTVVWDQDRQEFSREYLDCFRYSRYFNVKYYVSSYKELTHLMDNATCTVAIVVPPDFTRDIKNLNEAEVQVIIDGSDTNTASAAQGYVNAITMLFNLKLAEKNLNLKRVYRGAILNNKIRVLYNEELESRNFIVPGLIAVVIMVLAAQLSSLTVSREWDRGTMEQLIVTPLTARELITGKLLPYVIIGFIDAILAIAGGAIIFKVPIKGSFFEALGYVFIFVVGVMSWGIMLSVIAKNQLLALQMAIVSSFLPAIVLSGFMFPIYCMPALIQYITYLVPARYLIIVIKGIFLKGIGIKVLWPQLLLLLAYAIVIYNNACLQFKKKLT